MKELYLQSRSHGHLTCIQMSIKPFLFKFGLILQFDKTLNDLDLHSKSQGCVRKWNLAHVLSKFSMECTILLWCVGQMKFISLFLRINMLGKQPALIELKHWDFFSRVIVHDYLLFMEGNNFVVISWNKTELALDIWKDFFQVWYKSGSTVWNLFQCTWPSFRLTEA